jgi:hypothetical protein
MPVEKSQNSDRFQIVIAVAFMGFLAVLLLVVLVSRTTLRTTLCGFEILSPICSNQQPVVALPQSEEFIPSRIDIACVDAEGLKVTILFDEPVTGEALVQVFSTGPDFFPSEQGMTDTYEISTRFDNSSEQMELVIPVDSMPVGEPIFGNIVLNEEGFYSHVAYLVDVSDCAHAGEPSSNSTPAGIPIIYSATCLSGDQMMIAFEFDDAVPGQYQAMVANMPYQLAAVVSQPALLYFSGYRPPEGPTLIRLVSAIDQSVLLEETYNPPVCNP